jgi:hypothetical protein
MFPIKQESNVPIFIVLYVYFIAIYETIFIGNYETSFIGFYVKGCW